MGINQAAVIELSEKQENILRQMQVGTHSPLHYKRRAEIILLAYQGKSNNEIERTMSIDSEMVTLWRNRYANAEKELAITEAENPRKLRSAIEKLLSDAPRSGRPPTFTNEQVASIIALSLQNPSELKLPFSHWTPELLKDEAIKRGIVPSISASQVSVFLKRRRI
jgi:putative transposase